VRSASPRPRSVTASTCCSVRWPPSASASPMAASSPRWPTCASGLGRWPSPVRRCWWTGWPRGCSGPVGWANQKVLYDAKRHTHTAQGLVVSTIWGDLLWVDGGWPGSCHEQELIALAGLDDALDQVEVASLVDRGFRGMAKVRQHWHAPVGDRRTKDQRSDAQWAYNRCQAGCARWWSRRSAIWPMRGRCAAGGGCCTGPATSSEPLARWSAWAAGCTGSLPEQTSRAPSIGSATERSLADSECAPSTVAAARPAAGRAGELAPSARP
jgi:hypothetical protein